MPIIVHETASGPLFVLQSASHTYAFGVDPAGLLRHLYFGPPIAAAEDFELPAKWDVSTNDLLVDITAEEFPWHGSFRSKPTCLTVRWPNGQRQLRLAFSAWTVDADELTVTLTDDRGIRLDLRYRLRTDLDVIERQAQVTNTGSEPITVTEFASAQFELPGTGLRLTNVGGHWGAEQQVFQQPVGPGRITLEARRGISTHHHNPYLLLDRGASEAVGEVWFAVLAWSGNFQAIVTETPYGHTLAQLGLNPYDSQMLLASGESLTSPTVVLGYSAAGFTGASTTLHAYGRSLLAPGPRPVLYNSWEATGFDVTQQNQIALARIAAEIGVELFVVDDGWFGRRGQDHDGLGDWWVNPEKFPAGLDPLIAQVQSLGMDFGIWVEPEMVSPASDLYAAHPDWVYRDDDYPPETARDQLVLDLTNQEVVEHLFGVLDDLLRSHDISYLKWDANRPLAALGANSDAYRGHIAALYDLVRRVKSAHPTVLVEACASGGGRVDFGALTVFDDFWPSDNTDAADRLAIQRAYSLVYPAKAMRAWVTDAPNFLSQRSIPLRFRCHSAMLGSLGIGMNLAAATPTELAELSNCIADYRRWRSVIQDGQWYRLDNETNNDCQFFGFVGREQALLFAFLRSSRLGHRKPRVRMRGLDPTAEYTFKANHVKYRKSGGYLMRYGIDLWLMGDYDSQVIEFTRQS